MRLLGALAAALLASAVARAQAPDSVRPPPAPSPRLKAALAETARGLRESETGRRLLELTEDVPVLERPRQEGPALRYVGGERPAIVVDSDRAPALSALDFETLSVVARWKAAARLPAQVRDGEMAARQALLEHALGKVPNDPAFAARLRSATARERALLEDRRRQGEWAAAHGSTFGAFFPGEPPREALERLGFDLYLFSEDPYLFYRLAAADLPDSVPTYDEAVDFLDHHEDALARARTLGGGAYVLIDGRMFRSGPERVAKALGRDGLRRLAERLGDFRGAPREELLRKVNAWLRAAP
ncbi:MAG: hypothetical protein KGL53_01215 [Elusimicrobia bacterium]|nr:hypothetical protein [Elusimicrobiota bacterium]